MKTIDIISAADRVHYQAAAGLFRHYADGLGFDLDFQDFAGELADLPNMYGPPAGCLLLAVAPDGTAVGCVGLRPLEGRTCEMKRLFVKPSSQGLGIGRRLAEAVVQEGRRLNYATMRLDTVSEMRIANALYESLGFRPIAPYRYNPLETAVFYELSL